MDEDILKKRYNFKGYTSVFIKPLHFSSISFITKLLKKYLRKRLFVDIFCFKRFNLFLYVRSEMFTVVKIHIMLL